MLVGLSFINIGNKFSILRSDFMRDEEREGEGATPTRLNAALQLDKCWRDSVSRSKVEKIPHLSPLLTPSHRNSTQVIYRRQQEGVGILQLFIYINLYFHCCCLFVRSSPNENVNFPRLKLLTNFGNCFPACPADYTFPCSTASPNSLGRVRGFRDVFSIARF